MSALAGHIRAQERVEKAAKWDRLKDWLANATTNGDKAQELVGMVEDLVWLIEEEARPQEPEPVLTGQALLDRARQQRLEALKRMDLKRREPT